MAPRAIECAGRTFFESLTRVPGHHEDEYWQLGWHFIVLRHRQGNARRQCFWDYFHAKALGFALNDWVIISAGHQVSARGDPQGICDLNAIERPFQIVTEKIHRPTQRGFTQCFLQRAFPTTTGQGRREN